MKDLRVSLLLKIKFVAMALLIIIGFSFNISSDSNSSRALNEVRKQYDTGLKEVNANISTLVSLSKSFDKSDEMLVELQTQVRKTRLSYKKIEYLVAYFDSYNTKKNINGAPLPSLEPNVPEITVLQPKGLQVLDEMVFSEEFDKQSEDFVVLALALQSDFEQVLSYQQKIKIEHRHVFESMRQELVRIFTLGVTGFDTPGSANGVEEAKYAFKGVYDALNSYMPLIVEKNKGLAILMDARMKHTIDYLETNHDFETFDRLAFLKEHIDPQYQILYTLHRQLGIEFYEETSTLPKAVNYEASSIFSKDFLNPSYFANQKIDEPNKVKRQALGRLLFFDPILSNIMREHVHPVIILKKPLPMA